MGQHSQFSPSSMYRIIACPASVKEASFVPIQPPSSYADKGTLLHDAVTKVFDEGPSAFKKYQLESADRGYVEECIDYFHILKATCGNNIDVFQEKKFTLASWGVPEVWGTSDKGIHDHDNAHLHVIDWKFGHGVIVHAKDNEQLLTYAAGVVGYPPYVEQITIHVVQPPLDHFDTFTCDADYLKKFVFDRMVPAIEEAKTSSPRYVPGQKQCRFCPASVRCQERYRSVMKQAAQVFKTYSAIPQVTNEQIGRALEDLKEVETYAKQLKIFAQTELASGRPVLGWKLVSGRSTRKWRDEKEAAEFLEGREIDCWETTLISPSQAEKLDRMLKKDEDFAALVDKPPGKPQLADEKDKRPALENVAEAAKAFADFAELGE